MAKFSGIWPKSGISGIWAIIACWGHYGEILVFFDSGSKILLENILFYYFFCQKKSFYNFRTIATLMAYHYSPWHMTQFSGFWPKSRILGIWGKSHVRGRGHLWDFFGCASTQEVKFMLNFLLFFRQKKTIFPFHNYINEHSMS